MEDNEIKANVVAKMHRKGIYPPNSTDIDVAASLGVPTHERGRAKELVADMAGDNDAPVTYHTLRNTVTLEGDEGKVARFIAANGGKEAVPWDLESEL